MTGNGGGPMSLANDNESPARGGVGAGDVLVVIGNSMQIRALPALALGSAQLDVN